ncbi:MAG: Na(+)/H(+) antiporter subunit D [Verrucomicrobia bacterium]|nr:Na(+)/H(+) antiporter subunit D [Verrucomicrobiota bacterium]
MTDGWLHPALVLGLGAALLPAVPPRLKRIYLLAVPALAWVRVLCLTPGTFGEVRFLDWVLTLGRVDGLSGVFGHIMGLMAVLSTLYGMHVKEDGQHMAAWVYAAGSLGAIYAGDYLTLFVFWELMAFSSVFLVWYRRRPASVAAGFRYLLVHVAGGALLLAGILMHCRAGGHGWEFTALDVGRLTPGACCILAGFLLNAAVPPLHAWLPDAYAEGTFNGSVFLSAFTTKTAVYALCRGFAGLDLLVPLGVVMALYGVVYAVLENDSRRLLAYHIVSQVGYMVAGVGLGTAMAINGACAHAFAHILYKGLLFMGCGAVLHMTGKSKLTDLGGLWEKMPWTFLFTLIGGLSISAFPLFSGFVSKAMIVQASFDEHLPGAGFLLNLASVGTFLHTGLKVPYFIWFGRRRCEAAVFERAADPPWNMRVAMAVTAGLCVFLGCDAPYLYGLLPNPVAYQPYTAYHVFETLQYLSFTAVGFFLLRRKLEPAPTLSLDLDWFYRIGARALFWVARQPVQWADACMGAAHRALGLIPLMGAARLAGVWDTRAVDGAVDGFAKAVWGFGRRLRRVQRGAVQETLTLALAAAAALAVALWFLG